MAFKALLTIAVHVIALISALPINPDDPQEDLLQASHVSLQDMANLAMSPHLEVLNKTFVNVQIPLPALPQLSAHSSAHLDLGASKETAVQALAMPFEVETDAGKVGAMIPAAAAMKGSVVGTALATPVILKAVALPGIAAGGTAALLSVPHLIVANARNAAQQLAANVQTSFEDQKHQLTDFLVNKQLLAAEEEDEEENPEDLPMIPGIDIQEGLNNIGQTVVLLKAGALGAATKGIVMAKKGAYVAGRIILKPIAILTGIHLKMIGSGLAMGGKLIGGTGAGIAATGTAVKFTGLGAIGLGASAVSWGLDKSTIDTHVEAEAHANVN